MSRRTPSALAVSATLRRALFLRRSSRSCSGPAVGGAIHHDTQLSTARSLRKLSLAHLACAESGRYLLSASSDSRVTHMARHCRIICRRIRPFSHRHSRFQLSCWHHLHELHHQHPLGPGQPAALQLLQRRRPSRRTNRRFNSLQHMVTASCTDLGQSTQFGHLLAPDPNPQPQPARPETLKQQQITADIRCMTHASTATPARQSFSQNRALSLSSTTATPRASRISHHHQSSSQRISFCHLFLVVAVISIMPRGSEANLEQRKVPRCARAYEVGQTFESRWIRNDTNQRWHFAGRKDRAKLTIEADPWKSAELTGILATTLLQDVMGVNVTFVYASGSNDLYQRISDGQVSFNVEVWSSDKLNDYKEHVVDRGTAEDFGLIGYAGQSGIYLTPHVRTLYPDISWKNITADVLLQRQEILSLLPRLEDAGPTSRFDNGTFICSAPKYPWCDNGVYTPPQCQTDPQSCRVLYMPHPSYTVGLVEQLVATHRLPLVVVYKSESWVRSEIPKLSSTNKTAVFFWWSPDPLTERLDKSSDEPFIRLPFEAFDPAKCFPEQVKGNVGQPGVAYKCDWPEELLKKIGSPQITRGSPQVATFLRQLMLTREDIMELLKGDAEVGNTTAVCDWIGNNVDRWKRWIPPPPTGYYKTIVPVPEAAQPILSIVLVSAILTTILAIATSVGLHLWSQAAPIRAQSPPFMQHILLGVLLMLASVYFEVLTPSTHICSTRIWLLSLGLTIVTSSILVKTWRIFQIVANRELKVRIRREVLVAAMSVFVVFDAVLLSLWTVFSGPIETYSSLSETEVVLTCSSNLNEPWTLLLSVSLYVFHALLIALACYLGYRIRRTATAFNESRYIAFTAYTIVLSSAFVVPIVHLPSLNPIVQTAIKGFAIVLTCLVILLLLVSRPVLHVAGSKWRRRRQTSQQRPLREASRSPPASPTDVLEDLSGHPNSETSADVVVAQMSMRISPLFSIKRSGSLFAAWRAVRLRLVLGECPALMLMTPSQETRGTGVVFSRNVAAYPVSGDLARQYPSCFMLQLGAQNNIVQTKSAPVALQWIYAINSALCPDLLKAHAYGCTTNGTAATVTRDAADDGEVTTQRVTHANSTVVLPSSQGVHGGGRSLAGGCGIASGDLGLAWTDSGAGLSPTSATRRVSDQGAAYAFGYHDHLDHPYQIVHPDVGDRYWAGVGGGAGQHRGSTGAPLSLERESTEVLSQQD